MLKKLSDPLKRVLSLVAIRIVLVLSLMTIRGVLGLPPGMDTWLDFMALMFILPWLGCIFLFVVPMAVNEALSGTHFLESLHSFVAQTAFFLFVLLVGITLDYVAVFTFGFAKNRKIRWAAFALHLTALLLGTLTMVLFMECPAPDFAG